MSKVIRVALFAQNYCDHSRFHFDKKTNQPTIANIKRRSLNTLLRLFKSYSLDRHADREHRRLVFYVVKVMLLKFIFHKRRLI